MSKLVNFLGNYPSPAGPTRVSTLWSERRALTEIQKKFGDEGTQKFKFIRYFILDGKTIFGFLEIPDSPQPAFILSVRDPLGAYSFSFKAKYTPDLKAKEYSIPSC